MPRQQEAILRVGAYAILALAALQACFLQGEMLYGRDLVPQFYPRLEAIGVGWAEGRPLSWNPWSFHGASWLGPRAGGVLYPGYVLFAALPLAPALAGFIALHLFLGAEGMRRLAREDLGPNAAWIAGLCYGLGGFLGSQYWALPYLISGAWLPWVALAAWRLPGSPARGLAGIGLVTGFILLAGEPQGALMAGLLSVAIVSVRAPAGTRGRRLACVAAGLGLSAALAGPQLLSMLDELARTNRGAVGYQELRWDFAPLALILDLLAPGANGDRASDTGGYWGFSLWGDDVPWCGISVGALGLAALVSWARARPRCQASLFAAGLVVSGVLISASDAGRLLSLRYSAKWLVVVALGLAWGVGFGWQAWERDPRRRRTIPWTLGPLAAAACLAAAALALGPELSEAFAAQSPGRIDGATALAATRDACLRLAVVSGLALAAWAAVPRVGWRRARVLLAGALALDLLTALQPLPISTSLPLLEPPPLARHLQASAGNPPGAPPRYEADPWRLLTTTPLLPQPGLTRVEVTSKFLHEHLQPNETYRFGIRGVYSFESVHGRAWDMLYGDSRFRKLDRAAQMALLDGEYLLATEGELSELGERVQALAWVSGGVALARNLLCPPWAYFAAEVSSVADLEEARDALFARPIPAERPVLLGPTSEVIPTASDPSGRVRVERFAPDEIELGLDTPQAGWLIVRDAFDPHWEASLDGDPVPVMRADMLYRAIRIPAGEHRLVFRYQPWWWLPGWALLIVGATALFVCAWWGGRA
jgi:hypothetical protein